PAGGRRDDPPVGPRRARSSARGSRRQGARGRPPPLRARGRRAAHAPGDRRSSAPLARTRPPDRDAREGQAAALGEAALAPELMESADALSAGRRYGMEADRGA